MEQPILTVCNYVDVIGSYCYTYVTDRVCNTAAYAPGVCLRCVFTNVCVHLDGLNAEHTFRVWLAILGHTSRHFTFTFSLSLMQPKDCSDCSTIRTADGLGPV